MEFQPHANTCPTSKRHALEAIWKAIPFFLLWGEEQVRDGSSCSMDGARLADAILLSSVQVEAERLDELSTEELVALALRCPAAQGLGALPAALGARYRFCARLAEALRADGCQDATFSWFLQPNAHATRALLTYHVSPEHSLDF